MEGGELLQDANKPTLIILDDALVHSDAERLKAMKRVLYDADQRRQIQLFSCHPDKWRDLGEWGGMWRCWEGNYLHPNKY